MYTKIHYNGFCSVFLYKMINLYENITTLEGQGEAILCVRATVQTPICEY